MSTSSMQHTLLSASACEYPSPYAILKTNTCRIILAVLYWYVWTVVLPRRGGYKLEEAVETLDDGTTITRLVRSFPSLSTD